MGPLGGGIDSQVPVDRLKGVADLDDGALFCKRHLQFRRFDPLKVPIVDVEWAGKIR